MPIAVAAGDSSVDGTLENRILEKSPDLSNVGRIWRRVWCDIKIEIRTFRSGLNILHIFDGFSGLLNKSHKSFLPREVYKYFAKFHETGLNIL